MVLRFLEVAPVQGHGPHLPVAGRQQGRVVPFTAQCHQLGAELPRRPEFGAQQVGGEQRPPAFGRLAPPACPHRQRPGPGQGGGSIGVGVPPHHQPHRAQPGGDAHPLLGGLRAGGQLARQLQRPAELLVGGLVGQLGDGLLAGPQHVRQGPPGADHRGGLPAVIGHLGRRAGLRPRTATRASATRACSRARRARLMSS